MEAMTRRRLLFGLLLASAVLACFAGLWIESRPRVTRERLEQVKEGMSGDDVIRTIGRPPGDYTSDGRWSAFAYAAAGQVWVCDDAELVVRFDDADRAAEVLVLDPRLDVRWYPSRRPIRPPKRGGLFHARQRPLGPRQHTIANFMPPVGARKGPPQSPRRASHGRVLLLSIFLCYAADGEAVLGGGTINLP
jgi:hypothetical protein